MTRLMAVSSAFVVPENRSVFQSLADDYGFDVTLVTPDTWMQSRYGDTITFDVSAEERPGYRVVPLSFSTGRFERYRRLAPVIRQSRPEIVVAAHEFLSFAAIHSLNLARLICRRPLTLSCSLQNVPYPWERLHHRLREFAGFRASDAILASCSEAGDMLQVRGYRGRIEVTYPLGAATVRSSDVLGRRRESEPLTIGFVGRISREKGVFDLVDACGRLGDRVRLLIVGDGPDRRALEEWVSAAGMADRAEFAGFIPRAGITEYYRRMDVFVLPSLSTPAWKEQFGVVLAEAMLMGVAVVGSSSGAIPEVIGDAGLVFPEGDAAALASHLQSLYEDRGRLADVAFRGRQRAETSYTPKAMATRLVGVFQDMGAVSDRL